MPPEVAEESRPLSTIESSASSTTSFTRRLSRGGELAYDTGDSLGLSCLAELLEVGEIDALAAQLDSMKTPSAGGLAPAAPQVYRGRPDAAASRRAYVLSRAGARGGNFDVTSRARGVASEGS